MASTRLGYLAVKRETTVATAVKPTHFVRFKDGDIIPNQEIIANNPIQNQRWNAINAVAGKITAEWTFNVDLDFNECVHFLAPALWNQSSADISSGSDNSVFKHTLNTADTLPSLSLEQGKWNLSDTTNNLQNYQVDRAFGAMIDTVTLSGSDWLINMAVAMKAQWVFQKSNLISNATAGSNVDLSLQTVEWLTTDDNVNIFDTTPQNETDPIVSIDTVAKTIEIATLWASYTVANKAKVELVPQTPSYGTAAKVASFINVSFQLWDDLTAAASAPQENIENWEIAYENQLEERFGSLRASPSVIAPKGAKMTLKYTKYFENVIDRDRYLNLTKQAVILTITNDEIVSATDTNDAKYTVKYLISDVRMTSYEMPTGTDDLYAASVEAEAFYDVSDGKAVQIEVTNAKAGTEYSA